MHAATGRPDSFKRVLTNDHGFLLKKRVRLPPSCALPLPTLFRMSFHILSEWILNEA